jgi:hypothetical protein
MNNVDEIPLIDLVINAEKHLERRLAACLAIFPKETIEKTKSFFPEIDTLVIRYWKAVQSRRSEILRKENNSAKDITLELAHAISGASFWLWWDAISDENIYETITTTLADIRALRIARKAVIYIQENRLLDETWMKVKNV